MSREATTFATLGVPAPVCAALAKRGITAPFAIQTATIADALAGRDVCGRAPTGSGKTLAFGIPLVVRVGRGKPHRPRGLILSPTRELADQIADALRTFAGVVGVRVGVVYGGVGYGPQKEALRRGVDVLVACPGRLEDLIGQKEVYLGDVDKVVLDEADRMADMGFIPAVRRLLDQTAITRPGGGGGHHNQQGGHQRQTQTMLFSATLDGAVAKLTRDYQTRPAYHAVGEATPDITLSSHAWWRVEKNDRLRLVADAVGAVSPAIVFCKTCHGANRLAKQLARKGIEAAAIHGRRSQSQRTRALADFADKRIMWAVSQLPSMMWSKLRRANKTSSASSPKLLTEPTPYVSSLSLDHEQVKKFLDNAHNEQMMLPGGLPSFEVVALIATDVAARGIHIDGVALVVHHDPPFDHKTYIHRSGRTARAGASGVVLSLIQADEVNDMKKMQRQLELRGSDATLVEPDLRALCGLAKVPPRELSRRAPVDLDAQPPAAFGGAADSRQSNRFGGGRGRGRGDRGRNGGRGRNRGRSDGQAPREDSQNGRERNGGGGRGRGRGRGGGRGGRGDRRRNNDRQQDGQGQAEWRGDGQDERQYGGGRQDVRGGGGRGRNGGGGDRSGNNGGQRGGQNYRDGNQNEYERNGSRSDARGRGDAPQGQYADQQQNGFRQEERGDGGNRSGRGRGRGQGGRRRKRSNGPQSQQQQQQYQANGQPQGGRDASNSRQDVRRNGGGGDGGAAGQGRGGRKRGRGNGNANGHAHQGNGYAHQTEMY